MDEEKYSALVIGCGQCGARIAATFDKKPRFLRSRREDYYPISCFVFDTDPEIKNDLTENWSFVSKDNIMILPSASEKDVESSILVEEEKKEKVVEILSRLGKVGIGGLPFLGRIAAKKNFVDKREELWRSLDTKLKPSKTLLTINSSTGGTGTGFSPFVIDFLNSVRELFFVLNLSIIPADLDEAYPNSIISSLHHLLKVDAVDGIVLMDNAKMREFGCKNFYDYNDKIHEILSPILLSPLGKHAASCFGASLDPADLKRWTRIDRGFGDSDICALGYSSGRPSIFQRIFKNRQKREEFLSSLADKAIKSTTIDCDPKTSKSGVAVLSAPPEFYKKFLNEDAHYYDWLVKYLREKLNNDRLKLSFLQFEYMEKVYLSILMSGVYSPRIAEICEMGGFDMVGRAGRSIGEKIRRFDEEEVDRRVKEEIRKSVMKKIGKEK